MAYKFSDFMKLTGPQVGKLSVEDLKGYARAAQKSISQRVRRLEKAGLENVPAIGYINRVGRPSAAGNDATALRNELASAVEFFHAGSSTVSGARQVEENLKERFGEKYTALTYEQRQKLWEAFHKFEELHPEEFTHGSKRGSDRHTHEFIEYMTGKTRTGASRVDWSVDKLVKYYEHHMGIKRKKDNLTPDSNTPATVLHRDKKGGTSTYEPDYTDAGLALLDY